MNAPDKPPTASDLALLDEIAKQLIVQSENIRFGVAQSAAELEAVFRLRYREVIERGWAKPDEFPDGLERDVYDERALQIVGWHGDTLAATIRLVLPSAGNLLPTEASFNLLVEPHGKVVDAGRTVVAPAYRDSQQHKVLLGILGQLASETRAHGYYEMCGSMSEAVISLYRKMGIDVSILGAVQQYWGEERYPCRYNLITSAVTVSKRLAHAINQSV